MARRTSRRVRRNAQQPLSLRRVGRDMTFVGLHAISGIFGFYSMRVLANGFARAGMTSGVATSAAALVGLPIAVWSEYHFGSHDGDTSFLTGMGLALADRMVGARVPLLAGGA